MLSDEELVRAGCERLGSTTQRHELAAKLAAATWSVAAAAVACQRGQIERDALCALEVALALVQSQADATPPPAVWLLTTGTQQAARTHGVSHAGAWGLARSARAEARLPVRCVDGGLAAACECGDALLEPELVVRSAHRLAPRLSAAPHFSDMTLAMSDTKLHVVTGGTGGLGLLTGRWLAQRGTGALFLASRSGTLAAGMASEWEQLQASCEAALLERCDTSEATDVLRLVAAAQRLLPVTGVWHAAGLLSDGVLPKQTAQSLARVYAPKVHGGWALQLAGAAVPLEACVLFSSVAALLGGAGQANYCSANATLDALAAHHRTHGSISVSVQWGAWAEVGMAARGVASERMAAMEAAAGFGRVSLVQGLGALHAAALSCAPSPLGVMPVQWHRMLGGGGVVPTFLSGMVPPSARVKASAPAAVQPAASSVSLEAVL